MDQFARRLVLDPDASEEERLETEAARLRLQAVVDFSGDRVFANATEAGWQRWDDFCATSGMAPWKEVGAWVLFLQIPGSLLQRKSRLETGFSMLAAAATAHYAMCFNHVLPERHVDLDKFAIGALPASAMWEFVRHNRGVGIDKALPLLTGLEAGSALKSWFVHGTADGERRLERALHEHGPVMVTMCQGPGVFLSITLVGVREVAGAGKRFLGQTWTRTSQFVEVHCADLERKRATATSICSRSFVAWPEALPTTLVSGGSCIESSFTGAEVDDCLEKMP